MQDSAMMRLFALGGGMEKKWGECQYLARSEFWCSEWVLLSELSDGLL